MKKIDCKGNYLEFNGITVISFLHFNKIFPQIYDILDHDPDIKKYYSPLPLDSYHMTVKNHLVGTKEEIPY